MDRGTTAPPQAEWVSASRAAAALGIPRTSVARLADEGRLSVRRVPGHPPRYSLADCQRLAALSVYQAPTHETEPRP